MSSSAIHEHQVHTFLASLFGEDLHAKRVLSLSLATLGVIHAASLSVYAIGQAVALARGTQGKHGVKQVDRLLSNTGIVVWKLLALWVPYVLGQRTEALVTADRTQGGAVVCIKKKGMKEPWCLATSPVFRECFGLL